MQIYDEKYFQNEWVEKSEHTLERFTALIPKNISQSSSILDIGCGSGRLISLLERQGYQNTVGIDISVSAVKAAKVKKAKFLVASAEEGLPFVSESFDLIFFLDVIEHLRRPYEALQEIYRILSPNGTLILTTPNAGSILRPVLGRRWYALKDVTHLFYFNSFSLHYLLTKVGFEVEKNFTFSGLNVPFINPLLEKLAQGGQLVTVIQK